MRYKIFLIMILVTVSFFVVSCSTEFPSEADVDAMTLEEKLDAMEKAMEENPPEFLSEEEMNVEKMMADSMKDLQVRQSGSFEGRAHPTQGEVKIVEDNGKKTVILSDNFLSDAGPFLVVILAEHENPQSSSDLHAGDYVELGKLKSTSGTQTYELTTDGNYNTAVIYCKPFKVIFGVAMLE